jgi:Heparinase II/III-like protein/Heparinase II/III N-terminus
MTVADSSRLGWYARRVSRMSAAELIWRGYDKTRQLLWAGRQVHRDELAALVTAEPGARQFTAVLPAGTAAAVPAAAKQAVLAAAEELMQGRWQILGITRTDLRLPDWFSDPVTGRQAPASRYAFRINHRAESVTGNIKQLWELSRLQHLTLLATAWFVSHDEAYARRAVDQLESWWRANPFLSGVHWTSSIEVGLRLVSFSWIRRLLDEWPEVADHFEHSELALRQIGWHQQYLAAFQSRGSSANNHVIAEAAGQLVASCAFPWFARSGQWRQTATRLFERELIRNTFPSGIGRELASGYHSFVAELGVLAAVEAAAAGYPLSAAVWERLCATLDSGAALLDERGRPPRQGDGDEGRGLLLDPPSDNRWPSLLALGAALFGRLDWWPATTADAASTIIAAMPATRIEVGGRPATRPWHFADAGITLLRGGGGRDPEIWCRCDGGPHGFLSTAAHAHADALSAEVRYGGVDVLADPGTYCYHDEHEWRSYFRSTIAHNTVELDGTSQSRAGGPFLWVRHATARVIEVRDVGDAVEWTAEHDGYRKLDPPAWHRRCVRLDRAARAVDIVDEIAGGCHDLRLAFHLGPDVEARLAGCTAILRWPDPSRPDADRSEAAWMELPPALHWSLHRGETGPILGWYSAGLGRRQATCTLIGRGRTAPAQLLSTRLEFLDAAAPAAESMSQLGKLRIMSDDPQRLSDPRGMG